MTSSPAGEAMERFELGISDIEIENYLLKIGRPRRSTRRVISPEMEVCEAPRVPGILGGLFRKIRDCSERSLSETQSRQKDLEFA